ncbi:hypothetical protein B484DRAFT_449427 [Ochromonadaceae sp. CCMP2298]|nr:hypothetical protein B484DRAFT_449427 [Ochromonadaceae sp. CCMP2298]|mmetsp:Transcript_1000/g.2206  ORF Transcript_1000/g.2206 Transcript_1000/m.2206 type:complete len:327 (+) Transcript_1000:96-1076(+)
MSAFADYCRADIEKLMQDDLAMIQLANTTRSTCDYPSQSKFRVYAILVVETSDGVLRMMQGANAEQGYIGGAICAERAALCSLRFTDKPVIKEIVVVTDSDNPLSPGALCREFLMSHAQPSVPVVMGNGTSEKITRCALGEIYPHPYLYRYQERDQLLESATMHAIVIQKETASAEAQRVYAAARSANSMDSLDAVHPLRFSAAVLFDDGIVEVAWQLKGLEYGCTLDPVSQLVRDMERRRFCAPCGTNGLDASAMTARPVILVCVDQFGVAHGPFAQARSLLTEHGYGFVQVLVHDAEGILITSTADDLLPQPPGCQLLSHDDFN